MSYNEIQRQAVQLSVLEKYELLWFLASNLKSLTEEELEPIQAAEAAKRLEDIQTGKTAIIVGNDWQI
jgi:Putative addiction module component